MLRYVVPAASWVTDSSAAALGSGCQALSCSSVSLVLSETVCSTQSPPETRTRTSACALAAGGTSRVCCVTSLVDVGNVSESPRSKPPLAFSQNTSSTASAAPPTALPASTIDCTVTSCGQRDVTATTCESDPLLSCASVRGGVSADCSGAAWPAVSVQFAGRRSPTAIGATSLPPPA